MMNGLMTDCSVFSLAGVIRQASNIDFLDSHSLHLHVPEGATPKDGSVCNDAFQHMPFSVVCLLVVFLFLFLFVLFYLTSFYPAHPGPLLVALW